MKKKSYLYLFGMTFFVMSLLTVGFSGSEAFAQHGEVITWKCQAVFPPPEKVLGFMGVYGQTAEVIRRVKERTNGKFDIKHYMPGTIGIGVPDALSAVKKGAVDMSVGSGIYATGLVPEARIQHSGLPYAATKPEQGAHLILKTDFVKVLRQAYAERTKCLLLGLTSACSVAYVTTFPINSLASLKGKKIRASGGMVHTVRAHGATSVSIAPAELYMALQTGTVDGVVFPPYTGISYKLFEVAKYVSLPPISPYTAMDWVVNEDAWNKLPKEFQKILQEEVDKMSRRTFEEDGPNLDKYSQEEGEIKMGAKYIQLSNEEFMESRKVVKPLWSDLANISSLSKALVEIIKADLDLK